MPTELLTSKLFIPPLRPGLAPRPRLAHLLNEGLSTKRKLTLVSAPAGFGKTTLVAAFQRVNEQIGAPFSSALQSPLLPTIDNLLIAVLKEITLRIDPLILVLEDYHLLAERAILEVMEFLIYQQPPPLRCSVSSSPKLRILEPLTCPMANPTVQSSQGTKGNRLMPR